MLEMIFVFSFSVCFGLLVGFVWASSLEGRKFWITSSIIALCIGCLLTFAYSVDKNNREEKAQHCNCTCECEKNF